MTDLEILLVNLRSDVLLRVCRHEGLRVSRSLATTAVQTCTLLESALRTVKDQQTLFDRGLRRLIVTARFLGRRR
jgi:hypothetical protein